MRRWRSRRSTPTTRRAAEVTREQQKLRRLVDDHRALRQVERELREAAALAARGVGGGRTCASSRRPRSRRSRRRAAELREAVLLAMIPPEASDSRNTVMEIRAGTGGEEAALFAAELARCYQKYADSQGWKVQPMSSSPSERGGLREIAFLIVGTDVYKQLKWESGVHRVQRVPVTEASGRDPHLDRDGRGPARGRGGRHPDRARRTWRSRSARASGPGRPGGQHDRLRRADPAQADGPHRPVRRRALADQEQGAGR